MLSIVRKVVTFAPLIFICIASDGLAETTTSIAGAWQGDGTFTPTNGQAERVSCKITYHMGSGKQVLWKALCSAGPGTLAKNGGVIEAGPGRYIGRVREDGRIIGKITINLNPDGSQTLSAKGGQGSATVTLRRK